ncbi:MULTISPECIES: hypothetical protein [Microbacterium]|uniref:hypothetical protein n=1 Tax=Microbacterium TaxID=33882 RepID=UPI00146CAEC3|nr:MULTISPECIES: hypothetical protein [Microbacterium]
MAVLVLRWNWTAASAALPLLNDLWGSVVQWNNLSATIPLVAAATFLAYLVGTAALPLSRVFSAAVNWLLVRARNAIASMSSTRVGRRLHPLAVRTAYAQYGRREEMIRELVRSTFKQAGIPSEAAEAFDTYPALRDLAALEMRLWSNAEEQYQEYDRVRSEARFREGVSLPLVTLGCFLLPSSWWLGAPVIALGVVLCVQSLQLRNEQTDLLAEALRAGLIESPFVTGTRDALIERGFDDRVSAPEWLARLTVAHRSASPGAFITYPKSLRFLEIDWSVPRTSLAENILEAAAPVRKVYEQDDDPLFAESFKDEVDRHVSELLASQNELAPNDDRAYPDQVAWFELNPDDDWRLEPYLKVQAGVG